MPECKIKTNDFILFSDLFAFDILSGRFWSPEWVNLELQSGVLNETDMYYILMKCIDYLLGLLYLKQHFEIYRFVRNGSVYNFNFDIHIYIIIAQTFWEISFMEFKANILKKQNPTEHNSKYEIQNKIEILNNIK